MDYFKKLFVVVFILVIFMNPKKADAGGISNAVDKGINLTAKATYYITKYTLKTASFVVKKTAKGVTAISKSFYKGSKDAFDSSQPTKPIQKKPEITPEPMYILPPPPEIH